MNNTVRYYMLGVFITLMMNIYAQDLKSGDETLYTISSPMFDISINKDASAKGYSDGSATIHVKRKEGIEYTYYWNTTPPQYTPTVKNLAAGMYVVTVKDSEGNSHTEAITIVNQIKHSHLSEAFSIYPNPSEGNINLTLEGEIDQQIEVIVYNELGQVFYEDNLSAIEMHSIDLHKLNKGLYYIKATWNEEKVILTKPLFIN